VVNDHDLQWDRKFMLIGHYCFVLLYQCKLYLMPFISGDTIPVSHHVGAFDMAEASLCSKMLLLAAGTGLTPMIKIILHNVARDKPTHLVCFNKTQSDILWREELNSLASRG